MLAQSHKPPPLGSSSLLGFSLDLIFLFFIFFFLLWLEIIVFLILLHWLLPFFFFQIFFVFVFNYKNYWKYLLSKTVQIILWKQNGLFPKFCFTELAQCLLIPISLVIAGTVKSTNKLFCTFSAKHIYIYINCTVTKFEMYSYNSKQECKDNSKQECTFLFGKLKRIQAYKLSVNKKMHKN